MYSDDSQIDSVLPVDLPVSECWGRSDGPLASLPVPVRMAPVIPVPLYLYRERLPQLY